MGENRSKICDLQTGDVSINLELLDGSDALGCCLPASKLALECFSGRRFGGSLRHRLAFGRTQPGHHHLRYRRASADAELVEQSAPDAAGFGDGVADAVAFAAGFALVAHWATFVLGLHLGLDNADLGLWLNHSGHLGPPLSSGISSARQQPRKLYRAHLCLHRLV